MNRQTLLPFTREEQTAEIEAAFERLKAAPISSTKLHGLRSLVLAVMTAPRDDAGGLSLDALAARLGVNERTVRNHLAAAEALRLLIVDRFAGMRRPHRIRLDFDGLRFHARGDVPRAATTSHAATPPEPVEAAPAVATIVEPSAVEPVATPQIPDSTETRESSSHDAANCPSLGHVRKSFPNVRKTFPIGDAGPDDVCLLYLPPTPQRTPRRPTNPTTIDDAWRGAAAAFSRIGLAAVGDALAEARALGRTPADVEAAVATFEANRGKLASPGAVRFFLRSGAWPVDGVEAPAQRERRRAAADDSASRARRTFERHNAEAAAEVDELETRHGPELDALPDLERDALAEPLRSTPGFWPAYAAGRWRRPGLARSLLLDCLAAVASKP